MPQSASIKRQIPRLLSDALTSDFQRRSMVGFRAQNSSVMTRIEKFNETISKLELLPNSKDGLGLLKEAVCLAFSILRQQSRTPRRETMELLTKQDLPSIVRLSQVSRYVQTAHNIIHLAQTNPEIVKTASITFLKPYPQFKGRWVHAEVQLLIHYELSETGHWPRAIESSKAACFLCKSFIQCHKSFTISKSHGRFYSLWTLPNVSLTHEGSLQRIVDACNALSTSLDRLKIQGRSKSLLSYRGESVISLKEVAFRGPSTIAFLPLVASALSLIKPARETLSESSNSVSTTRAGAGRDATYAEQRTQTTIPENHEERISPEVQTRPQTPLSVIQEDEKLYEKDWLILTHSHLTNIPSTKVPDFSRPKIRLETIDELDEVQQSRVLDVDNLQLEQTLSIILGCTETEHFLIKSCGRYMRVWIEPPRKVR
jgi:hypothetical protein